jgi:hypothetical protein
MGMVDRHEVLPACGNREQSASGVMMRYHPRLSQGRLTKSAGCHKRGAPSLRVVLLTKQCLGHSHAEIGSVKLRPRYDSKGYFAAALGYHQRAIDFLVRTCYNSYRNVTRTAGNPLAAVMSENIRNPRSVPRCRQDGQECKVLHLCNSCRLLRWCVVETKTKRHCPGAVLD